MYKIVLLFLFFSLNFVVGQGFQSEFRANYRMTYILDSLTRKAKVEDFKLFFNRNQSYFLSDKSILSDFYEVKGEVLDMKQLQSKRTLFLDRISYDATKKDFSVYLNEGKTYYKYKQNAELIWNITNETKTINNIVCKKATTAAFGRKWIAYFSTDYTFPFGPFKINGLPGLIVSVEDDRKTIRFVLDEIEKHHKFIQIPSNVKAVSKEQYFKLYDNLVFNLSILNHVTFVEDPSFKQKLINSVMERKRMMNNFPMDLDMKSIME